jgi:hypothetical protein
MDGARTGNAVCRHMGLGKPVGDLRPIEDTGPMASRCLELARQRTAQVSGLSGEDRRPAVHVAKHINLPLQHALLVLRAHVPLYLLRHLQRSLKSNDLVHLWDKLNAILRDAVASIRGRLCPTHHLDLTHISQPINMGGEGIHSGQLHLMPTPHLARHLKPSRLATNTNPERTSLLPGTRRRCWSR